MHLSAYIDHWKEGKCVCVKLMGDFILEVCLNTSLICKDKDILRAFRQNLTGTPL